MKTLLPIVGKSLYRVTIWTFALLLSVELLAFAGISISNYLIYGHFKEGSRVKYDPYALFLNVKGGRPTRNNPPDGTAGRSGCSAARPCAERRMTTPRPYPATSRVK